jgi:hypothetical protein
VFYDNERQAQMSQWRPGKDLITRKDLNFMGLSVEYADGKSLSVRDVFMPGHSATGKKAVGKKTG